MRRAFLKSSILALALAGCGGAPEPVASQPVLPPVASAPAAPVEAAPGPREPFRGPHGEIAGIKRHRVEIVLPSGSSQIVEPAEIHPPAGDRSLFGISPTALLFLDDGTLIVGMGDGTVTVLDGSYHRRRSLGFRGAIRGLTAAGEGLVAVTTDRGVVALVSGEGKLRWDRQVTAERLGRAVVTRDGRILAASQRGVFALSRTGDLLFSHASSLLHQSCEDQGRDCKPQEVPDLSLEGDEVVAGRGLRFRMGDPHPAVPDLTPVFPLTFRKVMGGDVVSLLSTWSGELLALAATRTGRSEYEWGADDKHEVVRVDGSRLKRIRVPGTAAKSEVFVEGTKAAKGNLFVDALVAGPNGNPWVLARRISNEKSSSTDSLLDRFGGAGQILELRGDKLAERDDLFDTFSKHWLSTRIAATPDGPVNLLCFGHDKPACAAHGGSSFHMITAPDRVVSARRIGDRDWILTRKGEVFRSDGKGFTAVERPRGTVFKAVAGTGERDVWADFKQRYTVLHFDGARWAEVPVPVPVEGFSVRAADDVWGGRVHWDGKQWSLVHGAPPMNTAIARSRDDVWVGGAQGLWHGTAPGPSPVRLPAASPDDGVIPASTPLSLDAPEKRYAVERMSLAVTGANPLTAAKNVSASADGTLWIQAWDRIVEVDDGGKATTLRRGGRESFTRWAQPEAKGKGLFLDGNEVRRVLDRKASPEDLQLQHRDAVAVHANGRGVAWVVGVEPFSTAPASPNEFFPYALVRDGGAAFRPVLGVPAAAWCDVAAAPDGGAWFAGALNQGPSGEGILFHARGRLGSEATSRHRAPATLLAVTAVGPDEAWAVGAAGTVIHVRGGAVTRYALATGEWLRAAFASAPDDVWIGGDGGTLLHYDGRAFHSVDHPLGANAAFTGLASAKGALWVTSPSGILRITKRP